MHNWLYKKYTQKVLGKFKPFQQINWKYYPTPGCRSHCAIVGQARGDILFRNYWTRPQTAHRLYWKTHPAEYAALLRSNDLAP